MDPYNTTNVSDTQELDIIDKFYAAGEWVDLFIRILGLVTNPLILIVLSRQKIGSKLYDEYFTYLICLYCIVFAFAHITILLLGNIAC